MRTLKSSHPFLLLWMHRCVLQAAMWPCCWIHTLTMKSSMTQIRWTSGATLRCSWSVFLTCGSLFTSQRKPRRWWKGHYFMAQAIYVVFSSLWLFLFICFLFLFFFFCHYPVLFLLKNRNIFLWILSLFLKGIKHKESIFGEELFGFLHWPLA